MSEPQYPQQPGQPPPAPQYPTYGSQVPYGFPPPPPPEHPNANLAMILGLVSVLGGMACGLPLLASPFAWVVGAKANREIKASNGQLGGQTQATVGFICGIVGTILLIGLTVLFVMYIAAIGFFVAS